MRAMTRFQIVYQIALGFASKLGILGLMAAAPNVGMLNAGFVAAQSFDHALATGGKARVNRSATLNALTEAVASASCRVNAGISPITARLDLSSSRREFDQIMRGLANGDPALGMPGAETRARSLDVLNRTSAIWSPLSDAAARLAAGSGTETDAAAIVGGLTDLTEKTQQIATVIAGQYANPQQILQSDATVQNFAIRQRTLAHRMTRTMCELHTGTGDDSTLAELLASVELFQHTLVALRDGLPDAGINPPPNDAIYNSLSATHEFWTSQRGIFDAALAGEQPTADDVKVSALLAEALSVAMHDAALLYLIASPGQDDVYRLPLETYARAELANWLKAPALLDTIRGQNEKHAALTEEDVITLIAQWRTEVETGGGPLSNALRSAPMSLWLQEQQAATRGLVTDVLVIDRKGLSVAKVAQNSGPLGRTKPKWRQTYLVGPDAMHISEAEFDDSRGFYRVEVSLPIIDPETEDVIGAATFGVDLQGLM